MDMDTALRELCDAAEEATLYDTMYVESAGCCARPDDEEIEGAWLELCMEDLEHARTLVGSADFLDWVRARDVLCGVADRARSCFYSLAAAGVLPRGHPQWCTPVTHDVFVAALPVFAPSSSGGSGERPMRAIIEEATTAVACLAAAHSDMRRYFADMAQWRPQYLRALDARARAKHAARWRDADDTMHGGSDDDGGAQ